jgi:hypothetical protein
MRPVAQAEARRDVVDHGLDRALRVSELPGDLLRVEAFGHQAEHVDLALGESRHREAARREDLPLQLADLM